MLFIVSDVELRSLPTGTEVPAAGNGGLREEDGVRVTIERADGMKCERCWRYVDTVSTDPLSAGLCERCRDALAA
jgi:isoleucyl-tRNA synthetase